MLSEILEATKLRNNGKIDVARAGIYGVLLVAFLAWRLTSGTHGAPEIMNVIEQDMIDDYRQTVYRERDAAVSSNNGAEDPGISVQSLSDIDVQFSNVSMSAPVTSWSVTEPVIVRFDFRLSSAGKTIDSARNRYVQVTRNGSDLVWESGALRYYLNLLF